jgi:hypothetical protein
MEKDLRIYFYAGEKESSQMVPDMQKMLEIIKEKNCCSTGLVTSPAGEHKEKYWRDEFDDFYRWIMQ